MFIGIDQIIIIGRDQEVAPTEASQDIFEIIEKNNP